MKQCEPILSVAARMIPLPCSTLAVEELLAGQTMAQFSGPNAEAFVKPAGQTAARWRK